VVGRGENSGWGADLCGALLAVCRRGRRAGEQPDGTALLALGGSASRLPGIQLGVLDRGPAYREEAERCRGRTPNARAIERGPSGAEARRHSSLRAVSARRRGRGAGLVPGCGRRTGTDATSSWSRTTALTGRSSAAAERAGLPTEGAAASCSDRRDRLPDGGPRVTDHPRRLVVSSRRARSLTRASADCLRTAGPPRQQTARPAEVKPQVRPGIAVVRHQGLEPRTR
jgi:hypothetical protein